MINPISVLAFESSKIGCNLAAEKRLDDNRKGLVAGTHEIVDGMIQKKAQTSSNGG
jgi:hypothetical protein